MADKRLLEDGTGYWALEDGSGVWLLEGTPAVKAIAGFQALSHGVVKWPGLHAITHGAVQYPALAPASGGIVVDAAEFDGSTGLVKVTSVLSSGHQYTITGFFNTGAVTDNDYIFASGNLFIEHDATSLGVTVFSAGFTSSFSARSTSSYDDGNWHSFAISIDTDFSAGNKLCKMYVDKADASPTLTDADAAFTVDMTADGSYVGNFSLGDFLTGCMAELTADEQFIDFDTSSNLDLFFTAANKPEDIGTDGSTAYGAACAMYLHLDDAEAPDNFKLNAGTGGDFTVTGTLTTCGTSPSD